MFAFTTVPLPSTIYIPSLSPLVKLVVVPLSLVRVFALASLLVKPWSVTVKDSGEDFDAGDVPAMSLSSDVDIRKSTQSHVSSVDATVPLPLWLPHVPDAPLLVAPVLLPPVQLLEVPL